MASYSGSSESCKSGKFLFHRFRLSSNTSISISVNGCICPPYQQLTSATGMLRQQKIQGLKSLVPDDALGLTGWHHTASIAWSQIKAVTGATQTGRACPAIILHIWLSREDSRGHRNMVITKLNIIKQEKSGHCYRSSQAMSMDELGVNWCQETVFADDYGTSRLVFSSSLHLLPPSHNPPNHKQWGFPTDDTCKMGNSARDPPVYSFILQEFTPDVHLVP